MDEDDRLIGRLLSRREAVALLGAGAVAAVVGNVRVLGQTAPAAGMCVVRPELTEGPYFVDRSLERSDIRANSATRAVRAGVPLTLTFNVSQIAGGRCGLLSSPAVVHLWQCDAVGVYTGVQDPQAGAANLADNALRGTQTTGRNGVVRFTTIYPGWYQGRAVHLHFKIRTEAGGQAYEYTSQLFFPEALTDTVHAQAPYAAKGTRDRRNENDGIFRAAGEQLVLRPARMGEGYQASFTLALDLSDANVGRPDAMGNRGGGPGRGGRGRGL